LTGHCGSNAFKALRAAGIKVGTQQSGTAREALGRFNRDEVVFAEEPDVEAYW